MDSDSAQTDAVRALLWKHVPAIASGEVEIKGIVREPGKRAIVAVHSRNAAIDAVGTVVGERGRRVKLIVMELDREPVDVVRWSDSIDQFIRNLLAPLRIAHIDYNKADNVAVLSLEPGVGEMYSGPEETRLQLASQLAGWRLVVGRPN